MTTALMKPSPKDRWSRVSVRPRARPESEGEAGDAGGDGDDVEPRFFSPLKARRTGCSPDRTANNYRSS